MKTRVTICLEPGIIDRIDRGRGRIPRSAAIEEMILEHYGQVESKSTPEIVCNWGRMRNGAMGDEK